MNTEELLRSTLQAKARTAQVTVTVDDVRRNAAAVRRRSVWRTTGLAAAAVLVVVGAPTAFLLRPHAYVPRPAPSPTAATTPFSPSPSTPSPSTPSPSTPSSSASPPGGTKPSASDVLKQIPQGRAPGITYLQDGTVHFGDGSTASLPDPTAPVSDFTSYHGGWLVATGGGNDRVRWYDNTGTQRSDGPGVGIFAVSEDGTRTAYAQSGAIHVGITSGMSDAEQTLPGDANQLWPVGFLKSGALVYEAGENKVAVDGTPLPGVTLARAVCAEADLVAGVGSDGTTRVVSPNGGVVWTSKTWAVWGFSPDGRYAAATNSPTGGDFSAIAILDARTGRVVAQHGLLGNGIYIGGHPVMDDDGTLLAAVTTGTGMNQAVLRLDRDGTVTRATEVFPMDPGSDADFVVFATRP